MNIQKVIQKGVVSLLIAAILCSLAMYSTRFWVPPKFSQEELLNETTLGMGINQTVAYILEKLKKREWVIQDQRVLVINETGFQGSVSEQRNENQKELQIEIEYLFPYVGITRKTKLEAVFDSTQSLPQENASILFWNIKKPE